MSQNAVTTALSNKQNKLPVSYTMMYDNVCIMYHKSSGNFTTLARLADWPALQTSGEVADGVVVF